MFENTSVKKLTCADFDDDEPWKLKNKRCAFVLVFAEWCGHCQHFKPEYIKFANKAQFIRVYALDADLNKNIVQNLEVKGFPTVLIYKDGEPIEEYTGERTVNALVKKAIEVCHSGCDCEI